MTSGTFPGGGTASFTERDGARFLALSGVKAPKGTRVLLLKSENPPVASAIPATAQIDLGAVGAPLTIGKAVDAWLYRTVVLWNPATKKSLGATALRSAQERNRA